jgi:signal peptidase II
MLRVGIPVAAVALLLDQLSKWWVLAWAFRPNEGLSAASFVDLMLTADTSLTATGGTLATVTSFFDLFLAWNRGISFSIFRSDSPAAAWIFAGIALAIVAGLLFWLQRLGRGWPAVAIGLIVGGAIGNVLDRVRFGAVVDFLYFHGDAYPGFCRALGSIGLGWLDCRWPAFNVADSAIFVGVAMLLIDGLFGPSEKAKKAPKQEVP